LPKGMVATIASKAAGVMLMRVMTTLLTCRPGAAGDGVAGSEENDLKETFRSVYAFDGRR
jgi:hypothetical protein